jgi:hypothetical protein
MEVSISYHCALQNRFLEILRQLFTPTSSASSFKYLCRIIITDSDCSNTSSLLSSSLSESSSSISGKFPAHSLPLREEIFGVQMTLICTKPIRIRRKVLAIDNIVQDFKLSIILNTHTISLVGLFKCFNVPFHFPNMY